MALLDPEHLADLPGPVLRALSHSGVLEREVPRVVTLTQYGRIRSARDARWMRFTAEERYRLAQPDFEWRPTVRALGLPVLKAVDRLEGGHGNMRGRLLGMMTLFDETGPHMDQGSLVRWLNETMWFPWVWATGLVTWEPVDARSAIGSVTAGETLVSAEFRFDAHGRLVDFVADRYRDGDDAELTRWSTPIDSYRTFDGLELAAGGHALWHLDDGDFSYIELVVEGIRFVP